MTFYNIIFGFLFLGACRQLLLLLEKPTVWTAATIAIVIFNDAVNTSEILEGQSTVTYRIGMKLIDLSTFVLLSLALIALAPDNNPVGLDLCQQLAFLQSPWVIWALLTAYWALLIWWNYLAGCFSSTAAPFLLKVISVVLIVPFIVGMIVSCGRTTLSDVPRWPAFLAFSTIGIYFVVLKPALRISQIAPQGSPVDRS